MHHCPDRIARYKLPNFIDSTYHKDYLGRLPRSVEKIPETKGRPRLFDGDKIINNTTYEV